MLGQVLGHDRGFLITIEFLVLCRERVPYVTAWFSGYRQLLGRDIVFPCRDSAFLSSRCRDRGFHVATETAVTRGQVLHLRVATGLALARFSLSQ